MRFFRSLPVLALFALLPAGCGGVDAPVDSPPAFVAAAARYAVRSDLMAVGDLGAPPKWYSPGYPPLRTVRLGDRSPDPEFATQLRPKMTGQRPAILDPLAGLTP